VKIATIRSVFATKNSPKWESLRSLLVGWGGKHS